MTSLFVLGASDPEMAAIVRLLTKAGVAFAYASHAGRRVAPPTAYEADGIIYPNGVAVTAAPGLALDIDANVVLVECGGPALDICLRCGDRPSGRADGLALGDNGQVGGMGLCGDLHLWPAGGCRGPLRCDHHREGDPGYGQAPRAFFPASSVGQVIAQLAKMGRLPSSVGLGTQSDLDGVNPQVGDIAYRWLWRSDFPSCDLRGWSWCVWKPGKEAAFWQGIDRSLVLAAAGDHCLAAAFANRCPGVDPEKLAAYRADERGEWLARGPGEGRDDTRREVGGSRYAELDAAGPAAWTNAILAATAATRAKLRLSFPRVVLAERSGHCGGPLCGCGRDSYGSGSPLASTQQGSGDCFCDCCDERPIVEALDLRNVGTLPELPTALALEGLCAVYRMVPHPNSRDRWVKVGIIGAGEGSKPGVAPVAAFLGGWAAAQGLVNLYGDAARGYAGGYEPPSGREQPRGQ